MILDEVDPEAREILQRSGFPAEEFERLGPASPTAAGPRAATSSPAW